jgi:high-affinity nickel permease
MYPTWYAISLRENHEKNIIDGETMIEMTIAMIFAFLTGILVGLVIASVYTMYEEARETQKIREVELQRMMIGRMIDERLQKKKASEDWSND